jgi:hypothetical protein
MHSRIQIQNSNPEFHIIHSSTWLFKQIYNYIHTVCGYGQPEPCVADFGTVPAVTTDILDLTAKIQQKMLGKKMGVGKASEAGDEEEAPEEEAPAPKKLKTKDGSVAKNAKKPAKAKAAATAAAQKTAPILKRPAAAPAAASPARSKAILRQVQQGMPFTSKNRKPVHFMSVTVFTDTLNKRWRIKPGCGRRDEKMVAYRNEPRVAWARLQEKVAEYLASEVL